VGRLAISKSGHSPNVGQSATIGVSLILETENGTPITHFHLHQVMTKFKKFTLIFLVIVVALLGLAGWFSYSASYSEGERMGRIIKVSKKGIFFKTHEGQLNVEGISSNPNSLGGVTSVWEFSVDGGRESLIKQIEQAMRDNKRVTIHYEEKFFQFSWRGDTKYFVTKIEVLN
jgi:regulator of protease activity HflC (stomatin/prohibitin superfamily)